ncbi:MAG TPA: FAD-dependent oxidoreductase, partial [Clostridiaceae bacterium]|nr:FAD-dependent oxidoreductase [Clostridiaceae bacterium]
SGDIDTKTIIIASGTRERKLNIPGEDTYASKGISYCAVCDGALFRGEKAIVIGGGNSAYEEADYMTRFATEVTLVLRRDVPRADQVNVDAVARNPKVNVIYNHTPTAFLGNEDHLTGVEFVHSKTGKKLVVEGRVCFPMVGLLPNTDFVGDLSIKNDEGFIVTAADMSTKLAGIYAAGDVRDTVLRQIVTAASDGSIAAQSIVKYLQSLDS